MKPSVDHILTSHVGSLPRPDALIEANRAARGRRATKLGFRRCCGRPSPMSCGDRSSSASTSRATANSASRWTTGSITARGGATPFSGSPVSSSARPGLWPHARSARARRNRAAELRTTGATAALCRRLRRPGFGRLMGPRPRPGRSASGRCAISASGVRPTSPISRRRSRMPGVEEGFMTAVAPGSAFGIGNRLLQDRRGIPLRLADAMREEYKAIVDAGFILQLDDPGLPTPGT